MNRNWARGIIAVSFVALAVLSYAYFRSWQAAQFDAYVVSDNIPLFTNVTTAREFQSAFLGRDSLSMICTGTRGGRTIRMHFYQGNFRADYSGPSQETPPLHLIINPAGAYAWRDDSAKITSRDLDALFPQRNDFSSTLSLSSRSCSAWQAPDTSIFRVPQDTQVQKLNDL